jgi:hypothetical protein
MKAGVAHQLTEERISGVGAHWAVPVEPVAAPVATPVGAVEPAASARTLTAACIGKWVGVGFLAGAVTTAAIAGFARLSHAAPVVERPSSGSPGR